MSSSFRCVLSGTLSGTPVWTGLYTAPYSPISIQTRVQHSEMDLGQWLLGRDLGCAGFVTIAVASLCRPTPAKTLEKRLSG